MCRSFARSATTSCVASSSRVLLHLWPCPAPHGAAAHGTRSPQQREHHGVAAAATSERCSPAGFSSSSTHDSAGGLVSAAPFCGGAPAGATAQLVAQGGGAAQSTSWRSFSSCSLSDAEASAVGLPSSPQNQAILETLLGAPLDPKPMVPPPKPVVVVISGPSGVGKDTVVARLKELREDLYFVVTATSRPKRSSELEGRDYFFVEREKFEQWIAEDMLLEHALVYGDYKGIPRQQVDDALRAGTDVVLRIDVQGAATVKRLLPDAITIFVTAEDEATLVTRLMARKTESADKLAVRVRTARAEVARVHEFDYVVVNGTGALETCVAQVSGIIDAEKARVSRRYRQQQGHASLQQNVSQQ